MAKLELVEGIGEVFAQKLRKAGVRSTDNLLKKGASPLGRKELAEAAGIDGTLLMEWINHCDLFRIKGVSEEYADLLEEAGVDTVPELAQRNADNLYQKVVEVNGAKNLVRRLPTANQVADWVAQAKKLPRIIEY
jgi:predicted flap endonuclease-1-like 5' DNA nuclease